MNLSEKEVAKKLLVDAKNLISDPKNWTQRTYARDSAGLSTGATDENANCWCSVGALVKAHQGNACEIAFDIAYDTLQDQTRYSTIPTFNDNNTHEAVMGMFDKAIKSFDGVENE